MSALHPPTPATRLPGLLRDLAAGFRQQMFFWGQDAVHPGGNLLVRQGFERRASTGLQGTSCYRLPWEGGVVELHGACAGWYPPEGGGFLFIRPAGRCFRWLADCPPVPGDWPKDLLESGPPEALHAAARPFLRWWQDSEERIPALADADYRQRCHRLFRRLPRSRAWLTPAAAQAWVKGLLEDPAGLPRARAFSPETL